MSAARIGLERSYWRHAVVAAVLFALLSFASDTSLVGNLVVDLLIVVLAATPHFRGTEAKGIHRGIRRLLGGIAMLLIGLTIAAMVFGIPLILFFKGTVDGRLLVDGVIGLGYLVFTAHLFRTPVDTTFAHPQVLDQPLPERYRRMIEQLPLTLRRSGYSELEIDTIQHHPNTEGLASLTGALSIFADKPIDDAGEQEAIRGLVDILLLHPQSPPAAASSGSG